MRMSGCRAIVVMSLAALASPAWLHADPFVESPIPLPWPDGRDVAIADFNDDGLADIATLDSYGPHVFECYPPPGPIDCGDRMLLTVAVNEGQGHFAPVSTTPAMCLPWTMATGDLDTDGRADVIIGNRGARDAFGVCSQPSVSFYPGAGDGGFGTPQHLTLAYEPLDMAAGDFDGDGVEEVAVILTSPGGVSILRVTGGVLTQGPSQSFPDSFSSVATGDLDGTGRDVIVVIRSGSSPCVTRMRLLPSGSLGQFEHCCFPPGTAPLSTVLVADLSEDPGLEIALGQAGSGDSAVTVVRRGASGAYCGLDDFFSTPIPATYGGQLAAADLDADGLLDLGTTDGVAHILSLFGDGHGYFTVAEPLATSTAAEQIASGDLDGNGIDDLAVTGNAWSPSGFGALALVNQFPGPGLMMLGMEAADIVWHGVVDAVSYDVVRGDVHALNASGGDYAAALEACVADDVAATAFTLPDGPPVGRAWWILGRANLPGGPGTYDEWGGSQAGARDDEITASPLSCP